MSQKTKITEIRENYTVNRPTKDSNGERVYEEKNFIRYKEIPYVTGWARFAHYILDIVFYYVFALILAVPIVLLFLVLGADVNMLNDSDPTFNILDRLISWLILYPGYYILFESTMGSTPGKIILGRIVVNEYGEKPSFATVFKRSYSRIVPFESFSGLSDLAWHDTWSETFVIRKKDLQELQLALKAEEFGKENSTNPSPY